MGFKFRRIGIYPPEYVGEDTEKFEYVLNYHEEIVVSYPDVVGTGYMTIKNKLLTYETIS